MKIKQITLYNIGPYLNTNIFDFTIEKDKNIVLIGGKNGAGKTTFFKAIKTCLYGCKVWGYDAPGKEYYSIINSLVNFKSLYDNTAKAYIELELLFDDGKQVNSYILHREWTRLKSSLTETFSIKKNSELIQDNEENDFINYLLSIIPPDMFNFYFFDGESIAEFFLGVEGNKNFRNAFLKLYGLDTLSIMVENFNRNIKKGSVKNSSYQTYITAKKAFDEAEISLDELKNEINSIEEKIDLLQIQLQSLQTSYTKEGGIGLIEWKNINSEIAKEENNRDNINRWLKEIANHYLPFVILEKQLDKLLIELSDAQENQKNSIIIDKLKESEFTESLEKFISTKGTKNITSQEIIGFIVDSLLTNDSCNISFDFSINQINKIVAQIYEKKGFEKQDIPKALKQLNSSLLKTKKLKDKLSISSIDGFEGFVQEKDRIEKQITELTLQLQNKKQEYETEKVICEEKEQQYLKAKENYEIFLKNKSINDMAERAAATYSLLEDKLVLRQSKILQEEFIKCFTAIINKNNFIDGIVIDKNINVIPYKYIEVKRNQLENYKAVNREFLKLFNDVNYILNINKLEFGEIDVAELPAPIKSPFSQGERQVYIMSIYLALLKTSHKDIPFFIDTPFARIDSNHRANIIKEFFGSISNQMFILSTDEEIVGEYKQMMDDKISDVFTLKISNYGSTTIEPNMYFGE